MSKLDSTDVAAVNAALDAEFGEGYAAVRDQQRETLQAATEKFGTLVQQIEADSTATEREEQLAAAVGALLMVVGAQNVRLEALETRATFGPQSSS